MLISSWVSGAAAAAPTVVATDDKNDIISYEYSGSGLPTVKEGQSKDVIDIVSLAYGLDSNGNATITLNLVGTPTPNNETFYYVLLTSESDTVNAYAFSGAYDSSQGDCATSCAYLNVNGAFGISNTTATISGNSITWTLPRDVQTFDLQSGFVDVSANMTTTANSTWSWSVLTWTGTFPYSSSSSDTSSAVGTWWEDSLDWSSTNSTDTSASTSDNSTSSSLPGLDFVSVVGVMSVSSVIAALVEKRKKNKFS